MNEAQNSNSSQRQRFLSNDAPNSANNPLLIKDELSPDQIMNDVKLESVQFEQKSNTPELKPSPTIKNYDNRIQDNENIGGGLRFSFGEQTLRPVECAESAALPEENLFSYQQFQQKNLINQQQELSSPQSSGKQKQDDQGGKASLNFGQNQHYNQQTNSQTQAKNQLKPQGNNNLQNQSSMMLDSKANEFKSEASDNTLNKRQDTDQLIDQDGNVNTQKKPEDSSLEQKHSNQPIQDDVEMEDQSKNEASNDKDEIKGSEGRWTDEEHKRFKEGLKMYGKNWNKVHAYVGTRNSAQTRSHAQKYFRKLFKTDSEEAREFAFVKGKKRAPPRKSCDKDNGKQNSSQQGVTKQRPTMSESQRATQSTTNQSESQFEMKKHGQKKFAHPSSMQATSNIDSMRQLLQAKTAIDTSSIFENQQLLALQAIQQQLNQNQSQQKHSSSPEDMRQSTNADRPRNLSILEKSKRIKKPSQFNPFGSVDAPIPEDDNEYSPKNESKEQKRQKQLKLQQIKKRIQQSSLHVKRMTANSSIDDISSASIPSYSQQDVTYDRSQYSSFRDSFRSSTSQIFKIEKDPNCKSSCRSSVEKISRPIKSKHLNLQSTSNQANQQSATVGNMTQQQILQYAPHLKKNLDFLNRSRLAPRQPNAMKQHQTTQQAQLQNLLAQQSLFADPNLQLNLALLNQQQAAAQTQLGLAAPDLLGQNPMLSQIQLLQQASNQNLLQQLLQAQLSQQLQIQMNPLTSHLVAPSAGLDQLMNPLATTQYLKQLQAIQLQQTLTAQQLLVGNPFQQRQSRSELFSDGHDEFSLTSDKLDKHADDFDSHMIEQQVTKGQSKSNNHTPQAPSEANQSRHTKGTTSPKSISSQLLNITKIVPPRLSLLNNSGPEQTEEEPQKLSFYFKPDHPSNTRQSSNSVLEALEKANQKQFQDGSAPLQQQGDDDPLERLRIKKVSDNEDDLQQEQFDYNRYGSVFSRRREAQNLPSNTATPPQMPRNRHL